MLNRRGKPKLDFNKRNSSKKKVTVIGDWMIKYLRRENFSSNNYEVKIAAHPGSTTENLIDYVKPVAGKKPRYFSDSYRNDWFNERSQHYERNMKNC